MTRTFRLSARARIQRIDLERELNEQQRAVVTAPDGPMLVVAGAGSGKTRTLIYRVARLLADGADPRQVMLVTFTSRAAREMVHRVQRLVPEDAGLMWAGTFHHVANRMLRGYGERLGLSPEFTILDREDAADLMGVCRAEAGVRAGGTRFPKPSTLVAIAGYAAATLRPLEEVLRDHYPMFGSLEKPIADVLARYAEQKAGRQLLDYDDLLAFALRLLEEDPDAHAELAERFRHVLVDEYQDTNAIQARLVDLLAARHGSLCVVGDDAQSIYRFRGACFANIAGFTERYPDAAVHRLEINYRSTPEILELANASIARNRSRLEKTLRAVRPSGLRPAVVPCADHVTQSRFIAEYILHLLDESRGLMDIAVLYRSHWHGPELQLELRRANIPFEVRGGLRFFEQAHIKDALAFLRLRHNPRDELAWQRVLRMVPRIGEALAHRIWRRLAAADDPVATLGGPLVRDALPPAARRSVADFAASLAELAPLHAPAAMLRRLLETFYDGHLTTRYEDAAGRRQDLEGVIDFCAQYATVEAFLSDVALAGDFAGETCVAGPEEQHFVTLSTVHQAKGLEWPVVLIPWMADGRFPTDLAMNSPADLEEERRLFHVAVTRARDELYLVVPQVWSNHRGVRTLMKPSRFLTELDGAELTETMLLEGDLPAPIAATPGAEAAAATASAR
ncbi:MAG: ATP-dependent helicase [Planctomycetota bacterium]|jgi:DNA helicase-2/ATP-dependent DNA helicase PcrA